MRRLGWFLALSTLLACAPEEPAQRSDQQTPPPAAQEPEPTPKPKALPEHGIQLRVHLLHSDALELLDTTMTRAEVEALVVGVNEIWSASSCAPTRARSATRPCPSTSASITASTSTSTAR